MKFDERNQKNFKIPPFFISMATAAKFVLLIPIFFTFLSARFLGDALIKLFETL
jgi:hypothetical protein